MVSLRQKERDCEIPVVPVDQINWQSIRSTLEYGLTSRGIEAGRAEELADAAIVATFIRLKRGEHVSTARVRKDCQCELATIQRLEVEQRLLVQPIGEYDDYPQSQVERRLSRLSPAKESTAANDAIRERRETDRLFSWFRQNWFEPINSTDTVETSENPDEVWCFQFNDDYLASLPVVHDTWQATPVKHEYSVRSYDQFAIAYRTPLHEPENGVEYVPGVECRNDSIGLTRFNDSPSIVPEWYAKRFTVHRDSVSSSLWFESGSGI